MTTHGQATSEAGFSERSLANRPDEDALPIGLLPPSFPSDYVAGAVVPYLLSGIFYGETPSVPMIDLALSKEEAVPIHFWGLLYEGWTPNAEKGATLSSRRAMRSAGRITSARGSICRPRPRI
jgi:hypothetical protein